MAASSGGESARVGGQQRDRVVPAVRNQSPPPAQRRVGFAPYGSQLAGVGECPGSGSSRVVASALIATAPVRPQGDAGGGVSSYPPAVADRYALYWGQPVVGLSGSSTSFSTTSPAHCLPTGSSQAPTTVHAAGSRVTAQPIDVWQRLVRSAARPQGLHP
jgi:hypothetical protein